MVGCQETYGLHIWNCKEDFIMMWFVSMLITQLMQTACFSGKRWKVTVDSHTIFYARNESNARMRIFAIIWFFVKNKKIRCEGNWWIVSKEPSQAGFFKFLCSLVINYCIINFKCIVANLPLSSGLSFITVFKHSYNFSTWQWTAICLHEWHFLRCKRAV